MREIKFRAWDNVAFQMYYLGEEEDVIFSFESNGIVATDITQEEEEFQTLHHLKYMQYTGLNDCNGKEIYENDVLKLQVNKDKALFFEDEKIATEKLSVIEWWQSYVNIGYRLKDSKGKTIMVKPSSLSTMEAEVIGNIYENPELLEESS